MKIRELYIDGKNVEEYRDVRKKLYSRLCSITAFNDTHTFQEVKQLVEELDI